MLTKRLKYALFVTIDNLHQYQDPAMVRMMLYSTARDIVGGTSQAIRMYIELLVEEYCGRR